MLRGLAKQNTKKLKKSKKGVKKLNDEVEELRDNIFYFIKNLDDTSVRGSNFLHCNIGLFDGCRAVFGIHFKGQLQARKQQPQSTSF